MMSIVRMRAELFFGIFTKSQNTQFESQIAIGFTPITLKNLYTQTITCNIPTSLTATPLPGHSFFDPPTPTHKVGSLSELLNSPPRRQQRRTIFFEHSDEESPPPSPTPLPSNEKRKRYDLSATGSASSTPSPNKSPPKRSRTKSPETETNIERQKRRNLH